MDIRSIIQNTLIEDIGNGDHSARACVPETAPGRARLLVKEAGVIAGIEVARQVLFEVDPKLSMESICRDGDVVKPGDVVFRVSGPARSILTAERTLLNMMQRMSGIATITRKVVDALAGTHTKVLDTRKTTPGMRILEKQAVVMGGGVNHRFGLYDMVMIKDNHIDFCGGIAAAVSAVHAYLRRENMDLKIEVETRNLAEVERVLDCPERVDRIMFDNFDYADLRTGVALVAGRIETEASGGITLANARDYALCGVDYISMGALTHSVKSLDLSLKAE